MQVNLEHAPSAGTLHEWYTASLVQSAIRGQLARKRLGIARRRLGYRSDSAPEDHNDSECTAPRGVVDAAADDIVLPGVDGSAFHGDGDVDIFLVRTGHS
jgi:hypothetical protein